MYHIYTEMPSGAKSRGYEVESEKTAQAWFASLIKQLTEIKFVGDLVVEEGGIELEREPIDAA